MRSSSLLLLLVVIVSGCKDASKSANKRLSRSKENPSVVLVGESSQSSVVSEVQSVDGNLQSLALGAVVRGTLEGASDIDSYLLPLNEPGWLDIVVEGGGSADLILALHEVGKEPAKALSDRGPSGMDEGIIGYPVSQESMVLVVSEYTRKGKPAREGVSAPYRLGTVFRPRSTRALTEATSASAPGITIEEQEPNESREQAFKLVPGQRGSGFLGWRGDSDLWDVRALASADVESIDGAQKVLDLELSALDGVDLWLTLLDSSGKELLERHGKKGESLQLSSFVPAEGDSYVFLRVHSKRSHPRQEYVLSINERPKGLGEELEPNESEASASALNADSEQSHLSSLGDVALGDVDYYEIPALAAAGDAHVEVRLQGAGELRVDLFKEGGEPVVPQRASEEALQNSRSNQYSLSANQRHYLRVSPVSLQGARQYRLSISLSPAAGPGFEEAPGSELLE